MAWTVCGVTGQWHQDLSLVLELASRSTFFLEGYLAQPRYKREALGLVSILILCLLKHTHCNKISLWILKSEYYILLLIRLFFAI